MMTETVCGVTHPHYEGVACELDLTHHVKPRETHAARWWWHYGRKSGHTYSWKPLDTWTPDARTRKPA